MSPSRWISLLSLAALLALPLGAAHADEDGFAGVSFERLGIRVLEYPSLAERPLRGGRAHSRRWSGLRLWAAGDGYAVGRRSAGYRVAGGAALPLDEHIDLTASFHVAGFALGDQLDAEFDVVAERLSAPFVGLEFEF